MQNSDIPEFIINSSPSILRKNQAIYPFEYVQSDKVKKIDYHFVGETSPSVIADSISFEVFGDEACVFSEKSISLQASLPESELLTMGAQFCGGKVTKITHYYFCRNEEGKLKTQPTIRPAESLYENLSESVSAQIKRLCLKGEIKIAGIDYDSNNNLSYKLYLKFASNLDFSSIGLIPETCEHLCNSILSEYQRGNQNIILFSVKYTQDEILGYTIYFG